MSIHERIQILRCGGMSDRIRHVERVEIRRVDECIDRREANMIGIDVERTVPVQFTNGSFGGSANAFGRRAHDGMLAIRLVPDRSDRDTVV